MLEVVLVAYSERELLARLIKCEAGGEGENGMKAVATTVMNRVNASEGEYARVSMGGNIRNIIFFFVIFKLIIYFIRHTFQPIITL